MNVINYLDERSIVDSKDTNLNFTDCNVGFLKSSGYKNKDSLLGLNDYDMPWCEYADFYIKHDQDALAGKHYTIIVPFKDHTGGDHIFLNDKYQTVDTNGIVSGTISIAIEIFNESLFKLFNSFIKGNNSPNKACFINKEYPNSHLSSREKEILYYVIRGKTSKMIGKVLDLSYRTVEIHIENIKNKLKCNKKSELITMAIQEGLTDMLPNTISIKQLMFAFE